MSRSLSPIQSVELYPVSSPGADAARGAGSVLPAPAQPAACHHPQTNLPGQAEQPSTGDGHGGTDDGHGGTTSALGEEDGGAARLPSSHR